MRTKKELIARGQELGIDVEPLANNTEREEAIAKAEADLAAKAAQDQKDEDSQTQKGESEIPPTPQGGADAGSEDQAASESPQTPNGESKEDSEKAAADAKADQEAEAEKAAGIYTAANGVRYSFKKNAPKTINIDGRPMTQQEILDDESIISELAYGNSAFLTQHF